ncbi:hypothetical protein Nepgr_008126 [Nepenthes gracilis]|uniref:Uncharacterized protein n=1 Tax=Nepenthes gracilis TaxID=150966 RepID=A0AAD3XJ56_NEPGR|nr:hypothetical protein Nepgr_008126 [Nepenthes gracilis]
MEKLCEELERAKAEIEKLEAEYQRREVLSESAKEVQIEQLLKLKQAISMVKKEAQELTEKADELSDARQLLKELKCNLVDKESIIENLSAANEKLRFDCHEKLNICEEENNRILLALEEANEKNQSQQQTILGLVAETESVKTFLSLTQKKCLEAEQEMKVLKEMRQRDDLLEMLGEENRKVKDQLKWKTEQFKHLEEAHEKLRGQFQASQSEWEGERLLLVEGISTLQKSLDSKNEITEGLRNQLEMCNQAFLHEEARRKNLGVQISEMKSCLENVSSEYQEAKSMIECSTSERHDKVSALRNSLCIKEMLYKEMEYKAQKLEQENQELHKSLQEFQAAQIQKAVTPSTLAKLRKKLKSLEETHRNCSANLIAKEAKWSAQHEKMTQELNDHISILKIKDAIISELKTELEDCNSFVTQLKMQNEELSLMLQLGSHFSDAQSMHEEQKDDGTDSHSIAGGVIVSQLMGQLDMKNATLPKAQNEKECEEATSLLQRDKEEMIQEPSKHQLCLKDEAAQKERNLTEELREACDTLERMNYELTETICEGREVEFELQVWKSNAEILKIQLEESRVTRREIEASLIEQAQVEETLKQEIDYLTSKLKEKDRQTIDLQQRIVLLHQHIKEENRTPDNKRFLQTEENDKIVQEDSEWLKQDALKRESEGPILGQSRTEKTHVQREIRILSCQLQDKLETSVSDAKLEPESDQGTLLTDVLKLSDEREKLLHFIDGLCHRIGKFSGEDIRLTGVLGRIVQNFDNPKARIDLEEDELYPPKENSKMQLFSLPKTSESILSERSALRDLN